MVTADYLFLVRHGESSANEKGIEAGPLPYPLAKSGRKDASFLSKALKDVEFYAAYSSPVQRAVETAKIIARPHGLQIKTLEGLTEAKIKKKFVGKKKRHHILTSPEAYDETNAELLKRTAEAVKTIHAESKGNVIVVSHGDVITAMLENVVERRVSTERYYVFHPEPASLSIVETKGRPFLLLYNYHRKLFGGY